MKCSYCDKPAFNSHGVLMCHDHAAELYPRFCTLNMDALPDLKRYVEGPFAPSGDSNTVH